MKEKVRLLEGEGSGPEVLRAIYSGLQTRQDAANSVLMVLIAAGLKFGPSPREIAADLALGTPDQEEWEEMEPDLREIVADLDDFDGERE